MEIKSFVEIDGVFVDFREIDYIESEELGLGGIYGYRLRIGFKNEATVLGNTISKTLEESTDYIRASLSKLAMLG